jgi:hypothetical protein
MGQVAGGPAVGAVGNASVRAALVLSGLLLAPALPLVARATRVDVLPPWATSPGVDR